MAGKKSKLKGLSSLSVIGQQRADQLPWGAKVIDRLAAWPTWSIVQDPLAQIPWHHLIAKLDAAIAANFKELGYGG